jgi:hypothetical protein
MQRRICRGGRIHLTLLAGFDKIFDRAGLAGIQDDAGRIQSLHGIGTAMPGNECFGPLGRNKLG